MLRHRTGLQHVALPLVLVLAVGLAGCTDDGDGEAADAVEDADESVVSDPEDDAEVQVEDTDDLAIVEGSEEAAEGLADAVAATRDSSVQARFTTSDGTAAASDSVVGEGVVDGGDLQVDLQISGSLAEAYGSLDTEAEVRVIDDIVYLRFPAMLATADVDAAWLRTTLDGVDGDPGDLIARALLVDPNQAFSLLGSPTAVAELEDDERIDGEQTTHYLATVELGEALATAGIGSDLFAEFEDDADQVIEVHAYVGEDGLIRRMEARMAVDEQEVELVVEIIEVDVAVDIETPPAEDVMTFDEFAAANT